MTNGSEAAVEVTAAENTMTGEELIDAAFDGGNEQEVAEPAAGDDETTGAEPENPGEAKPEEAKASEGEEKESGRPEQTKEENAAFAAIRRKAEAEAKAKIEEERSKTESLIAGMGIVDPVTGKPVTTAEELKEYNRHRGEEAVQSAAKKAGLSKDELDRLISQHPDVVKAQQMEQEMKAEREKAAEISAKNQLEADLKEVGELNPAIKSFEDLSHLDKYADIYTNVKRGLSLVDAYKLAYMDDIIATRSGAAAQQVRNAVSGKRQLQNTNAAGTPGKEIPLDELRELREWFPDLSETEIREAWQRQHR